MKNKNSFEQQRKNHHEGFVKSAGKDKLKVLLKLKDFWKQAYNLLCQNCQMKVLVNPQMKLEEYCESCQTGLKDIAERRGLKVK